LISSFSKEKMLIDVLKTLADDVLEVDAINELEQLKGENGVREIGRMIILGHLCEFFSAS